MSQYNMVKIMFYMDSDRNSELHYEYRMPIVNLDMDVSLPFVVVYEY